MKVVIDTSIFIDHLRGGPVWKKLLPKFEADNTEIFLPTIVLFELFSGESSLGDHIVGSIKNLLQNLQRIELTEKIAKQAGEIYRDATKKLDVPDYIIAASALEIGGTVVTLNRKHFEQVPYLPLFPLE